MQATQPKTGAAKKKLSRTELRARSDCGILTDNFLKSDLIFSGGGRVRYQMRYFARKIVLDHTTETFDRVSHGVKLLTLEVGQKQDEGNNV